MKRWDETKSERVEDLAVDAFLEEIIDVCHKHNMSIGHEDGHGAFRVHKDRDQYSHNVQWLAAAMIAKPESY